MERTTDVERAVQALRDGGVVAYPTDTLYGLAADPRSEVAVRRLFAVKGREHGHAVPLIAADMEQARSAADFNEQALRAVRALWPGPLSLILPAKAILCPAVLAADGTVAVRVPANALSRALAASFGFCITATSANLSGEPPSASPAVIAQSLGDRIDLVLDGGDSPGGLPSTLADLRGTSPRLVRAGAMEWNRVLRSIQ